MAFLPVPGDVRFEFSDEPTRIRNVVVAKGVTTSMRSFILLLAAACLCSRPTIAQTQNQRADNMTAAKRAQWPLQLEMRVPFEPTAFPSGPHFYVMYELHLTNFGTTPLSLSRIEVLDAGAGAAQPIATFD